MKIKIAVLEYLLDRLEEAHEAIEKYEPEDARLQIEAAHRTITHELQMYDRGKRH